MTTRASRAFAGFNRWRGVVARAIGDSDRYFLRDSEYRVTLEDVRLEAGQAFVTVRQERTDRSRDFRLIADQEVDVLVAGQRIGGFSTNGDDVQTFSTEAEGGEPVAVTMTYPNGDESATVTATVPPPPAPGEIVVDGVAAPAQTVAGEPVDVTVAATNVGELAATRSIDVTANGASIGTVTFDLEGGGAATRTIAWTPETPGTATIAAGGAQTTLAVLEPGSIAVTGLSVAATDVPAGQPVDVRVTTANPGETAATAAVTVTVGAAPVATIPFELAPGASATRTVTWTPTSAGRVEVAAGGEKVSVLVREAAEPEPTPAPSGGGLGLVGAAAAAAILLLAR